MTNEFTTKTGTVRVSQVYRDRRDSNIRWLRVDRLAIFPANEYAPAACRVYCTVIRQVHDGVVTTPHRTTDMDAGRLTSRSFILTDQTAAPPIIDVHLPGDASTANVNG